MTSYKKYVIDGKSPWDSKIVFYDDYFWSVVFDNRKIVDGERVDSFSLISLYDEEGLDPFLNEWDWVDVEDLTTMIPKTFKILNDILAEIFKMKTSRSGVLTPDFKWEKKGDDLWMLIGTGYYMEKNWGDWWVYNSYGIRIAGFENFNSCRKYINNLANGMKETVR